MNSLEVQEVQKEVSLLKSAVEVLHDEVRALKKKLKVIVYVKCRCTLTHNAHVSKYCTHTPTHTHTIVGLISIVSRKNLAKKLPKPSTTDMPWISPFLFKLTYNYKVCVLKVFTNCKYNCINTAFRVETHIAYSLNIKYMLLWLSIMKLIVVLLIFTIYFPY